MAARMETCVVDMACPRGAFWSGGDGYAHTATLDAQDIIVLVQVYKY